MQVNEWCFFFFLQISGSCANVRCRSYKYVVHVLVHMQVTELVLLQTSGSCACAHAGQWMMFFFYKYLVHALMHMQVNEWWFFFLQISGSCASVHAGHWISSFTDIWFMCLCTCRSMNDVFLQISGSCESVYAGHTNIWFMWKCVCRSYKYLVHVKVCMQVIQISGSCASVHTGHWIIIIFFFLQISGSCRSVN